MILAAGTWGSPLPLEDYKEESVTIEWLCIQHGGLHYHGRNRENLSDVLDIRR
jgi:hypothetical protein